MSNADGSGPGGEPPAYGAGDTPIYWAPPDQQGVRYPDAAGTPTAPPDHSRRNLAILGVVGVAILAVIAVAAVLIVRMALTHPTSEPVASEPPPSPVAQNATDCTHSVSSGEVPTTGMVSAGGLAFPQNIAPDWRPKAEHRVPNSIDAVSLDETVREMPETDWIGQLTVGITNFAPSLSLADQAELMLKCIVASELYEGTAPVVGDVTPTPGRLDGTPISQIDVPVTVTVSDPTIRGDDVMFVVVGTSPTTYFLGVSPIGDPGRRAVVEAARKELHITAL